MEKNIPTYLFWASNPKIPRLMQTASTLQILITKVAREEGFVEKDIDLSVIEKLKAQGWKFYKNRCYL